MVHRWDGLVVALALALVPCSALSADPPDVQGEQGDAPYNPELDVEAQAQQDGATGVVDETDKTDTQADPIVESEFQWLPACGQNYPGETVVTCSGMFSCATDDETRWMLWSRALPDGEWIQSGTDCYSSEPPEPEAELAPQVTDADVLREVRRVGLPDATVQVQPEEETLVQLPTIFYTDPAGLEESVTLLGFTVDIDAAPVEYDWHHGDGSEQTTTTAGAPYPAKDITHTYTDAHVTVHPSVDVTYQVRWRVDGGEWQTIDQTLTATGPTTDLEIKEGTPLLADPYR